MKKDTKVRVETIEIDESTCPACSAKLNCMTGEEHEDGPGEGSISVCAYCKTILVMDADLKGRIMTDDEELTLQVTEPDVWEEITAMKTGLDGLDIERPFDPFAGIA